MSIWCERAAKFHDVCTCVSEMFSRLTAIPNRVLLYDVYQYTWDAKEATMLLDSYIAWLGKRFTYRYFHKSIIFSERVGGIWYQIVGVSLDQKYP